MRASATMRLWLVWLSVLDLSLGRRVVPGLQEASFWSEEEDNNATTLDGGGDNTIRRLSRSSSSMSRHQQQQQQQQQAPHVRDAERLVSPSEHRVRTLPGLPKDWTGEHYAGMIDTDDEHHGRLFYWLFEKEGKAEQNTPLLIWLNGGPGCTSMDGLFLENGPLRLKEGSSTDLDRRHDSWHKVAHLVYVDQPVGTGFSHVGASAYCGNDECISSQFARFLSRLALSYPKLLMFDKKTTVPIFFSGESHAGHYVPLMVEKLLLGSQKEEVKFDVKGFALGNAWIDPYHQYDVSKLAHALGFVDSALMRKLKASERQCQDRLSKNQLMSKACWDLLDDVVFATARANGGLKVNVYDTRESMRSTSSFPPGHERLERYMNQRSVRSALHVDSTSPAFKECTNPPYDALKHQDGLGVMPAIKNLLERTDVRALFYNGEADLICNHVGLDRALQALDWAGAADFRLAKFTPWRREGHLVGYSKKSTDKLTLVLVQDAGHMVPMNQPEVALDLIRRFVQHTPFDESAYICPAQCSSNSTSSGFFAPLKKHGTAPRRRRGGHRPDN